MLSVSQGFANNTLFSCLLLTTSFSSCLTLPHAGSAEMAEQMLASGAAMEMASCTPFQHPWGGEAQLQAGRSRIPQPHAQGMATATVSLTWKIPAWGG